MNLINSAKLDKAEKIIFNDFIFGHAEQTNGWIGGFVVGYAHDKGVLGLNGQAYRTEENLIGYLVHAWPAVHGPDGRPLMFVVRKEYVKAAYRLAGPLEAMIKVFHDEEELVGLPFSKVPLPEPKKKEITQ